MGSGKRNTQDFPREVKVGGQYLQKIFKMQMPFDLRIPLLYLYFIKRDKYVKN